MLEAVDLECVRGDRPLFSHLSFSLRRGELLHVTGINGSGKTTLLRAICGLTHHHTGEIRWNGAATQKLGDEYHAQLAYVGHTNGIQGDLTPEENLRVAMNLSGSTGAEHIGSVLKQLGLAAYHRFPAKILSQGQKRRLALARLVVERKPLWIMDEPLSGLDVDSVSLMTTILTEHLAQGGLIIITSHQDIQVRTKTVLQIRANQRA